MYVFAVFLNRNETMQFINMLKRNRIMVTLVSTPKGLGSSCSVSAKFLFKDIEIARKILRLGNYRTFSNFFKLRTKNNHAVFEVL